MTCMMPIRFSTLASIQFRQWSRDNNKSGRYGDLVVILYFWLIEVLVYFLLKKEIPEIPSLVGALVCLGAVIPDFLLKLIFEHDITVMDAFLKTRPIPQSRWDRFLTLSQCWKPSNLLMPAILLPASILFIAFPWNVMVWFAVYVFSVFGGFLVMLLKHRGPYGSEKSVSAKTRLFNSGTGHLVFGLQSNSLLRSKRLKTSTIYLSIFFFLQYFLYAWAKEGWITSLYLFYFVLWPALGLSQYGMGIESAFFGGIWTKPLPVSRLLTDKLRLCCILSGMVVLICIPICLAFHQRVTTPLALALYASGFSSPLLLMDAYNCIPFDLFGKTFFNYQGSRGTYKASSILYSLLILAIGMGLLKFLPGWKSDLILALPGIAGISFYRPYFRWVEQKFLKNRYKYMEKYTSL